MRLASLLVALAVPTLCPRVRHVVIFACVGRGVDVRPDGSRSFAGVVGFSNLPAHRATPLQTLSNVVAALRENEYSFRAPATLAREMLWATWPRRLTSSPAIFACAVHRESETFALLERVVESMELPVFAFNAAAELQLTNPAARKMLQLPRELHVAP